MYKFVLFCLAVFIIGGNAISIECFGFTVRIGEILAIILGLLLFSFIIRTKVVKSVRAIVIWTLLSAVLIIVNIFIYDFSATDGLKAYIYLFRVAYFIYLAFALSKYILKKDKVVSTLKFINICYIILCFIGLFQLIFYPIAFDWYHLFESINVHWAGDPHINRLVSTDFDPNYFSCCLLIGVCADLYLLQGSHGKSRLWYFAVLVFYVVCVFLTKSRSGLLGGAIVAFFYYLLRVNWKRISVRGVLIFCSVMIVGICVLCFSNISVIVRIREVFSDPSALARFGQWEKSWGIMTDTRFMGIGYNLYPAYNEKFFHFVNSQTGAGTDSSLMLIVITTGIIGFIIYLAHVVYLYRENKSAVVRSLIIASLIICNFNNLLFYSLWLFPFYLFCYLMLAQSRRKNLSGNGG